MITWRPIDDGAYSVSDTGMVRSNPREVPHSRGGTQSIRCRILKANPSGRGYLAVCLQPGARQRYIHRLVAEAFWGAPPCGSEVNHRDGNKHNNAIENLEWVTSAENSAHAAANGLLRTGERCSWARLTADDVRAIRSLACAHSKCALGRMFGVSDGTIRRVISGASWKNTK